MWPLQVEHIWSGKMSNVKGFAPVHLMGLPISLYAYIDFNLWVHCFHFMDRWFSLS